MFTLNCKGRLLVVDKPIVMGIINTTPDSFYAGSRFAEKDAVLREAEKMLKEGALLLDVGGQSTRPGSTRVPVEEEKKRVVPVIELLAKNFPEVFISIDSYSSEVTSEAIDAGAVMVNDISAGGFDKNMIPYVAAAKVPYIVMHMQGEPGTMQNNPHYENISNEVLDFFIRKIEECRLAGINDIIIDPGFGFGKTIAHNFRLLKELSVLHILQKPILAGLSRKSTVYKTLGISPEEALNGTTVLNTLALQNGASILRVHDVKEGVEAIKLWEAYNAEARE